MYSLVTFFLFLTVWITRIAIVAEFLVFLGAIAGLFNKKSSPTISEKASFKSVATPFIIFVVLIPISLCASVIRNDKNLNTALIRVGNDVDRSSLEKDSIWKDVHYIYVDINYLNEDIESNVLSETYTDYLSLYLNLGDIRLTNYEKRADMIFKVKVDGKKVGFEPADSKKNPPARWGADIVIDIRMIKNDNVVAVNRLEGHSFPSSMWTITTTRSQSGKYETSTSSRGAPGYITAIDRAINSNLFEWYLKTFGLNNCIKSVYYKKFANITFGKAIVDEIEKSDQKKYYKNLVRELKETAYNNKEFDFIAEEVEKL